ncbi:ceramidase [Archangium violaceum]|uniref:ceramidase n=1 Tax=Archangium violaceum TaxID=83451 RepID=UPI00193B1885|nr:ceramidase [Archangium violaceum]QRK04167.1 ceramidase [Archangium violaceum]
MSSLKMGFWGANTATVDWCETNYQHSHYICELFNSASSLAMVFAGVLGIALHRRVLERRFLLAFAMVSVVGLGSIAFHATLLFQHQMLDELPMLYLALLMVYILVENRPERRFGIGFPLALLGYAVLSTYLSAFTRGRLQFFLFQASFALLEFFALARVYLIHRRGQDVMARRVFQLGVGSYGLAIVLWLSDIHLCSTLNETLPAYGIPNPQFHAWWHVFVSCGFYALLIVIAHDRLKTLGQAPRLSFVAGVIPFVRSAEPDVAVSPEQGVGGVV